MSTRLLSLLLVFVLSWAGFSVQAQAAVVDPAAVAGMVADSAADADADADGGGSDTGSVPVEGAVPAPSEALSDLPVVIHHRAQALLPALTMAPPGAPAEASWRSACLDGLQRPPSAPTLGA